MIIVSDKKIIDLNIKQSLYVAPKEFSNVIEEERNKFILYVVDDKDLFFQHYDKLLSLKKKVILIADYSDVDIYNAIKDFHAFLLIDKTHGVKILNQFL